jgi:hypothetical protein
MKAEQNGACAQTHRHTSIMIRVAGTSDFLFLHHKGKHDSRLGNNNAKLRANFCCFPITQMCSSRLGQPAQHATEPGGLVVPGLPAAPVQAHSSRTVTQHGVPYGGLQHHVRLQLSQVHTRVYPLLPYPDPRKVCGGEVPNRKKRTATIRHLRACIRLRQLQSCSSFHLDTMRYRESEKCVSQGQEIIAARNHAASHVSVGTVPSRTPRNPTVSYATIRRSSHGGLHAACSLAASISQYDESQHRCAISSKSGRNTAGARRSTLESSRLRLSRSVSALSDIPSLSQP